MTPDREKIAKRLNEADLLEDRFIPVEDGEKGSRVNHNDPANRYGSFAPIDGNYGVYAGPDPSGERWLVDVDIDDYGEDVDDDALSAVLELPETFTVASPHTDGVTGGHRYYVVECEDLVDKIQELTGVKNPKPPWGELRVYNQYVVGPGSQLDGCEKEWCDECATEDGGLYTVATDAPVAPIEPDDLLGVLRAAGYDEDAENADSEPEEYDPVETDENRAEKVAKAHEFIRDYLAFGASDRSSKDFAVCCKLIEYGVDETEARRLLKNSRHTKVSERGTGYWKETWKNARREVGDEAGTKHFADEAPTPKAGTDGGAEAATSSVGAGSGSGPDWPTIQAQYSGAEDADEKKHARYNAHELLLDEHDFVNVRESDELYVYVPDDGIYQDRGKREIREIVHEGLGHHFDGHEVNEMAEHIRAVTTRPYDDLGGPDWHIPMENGVVKIDGDGHELVDHSPEYYFLHRAGTEYDPTADCPQWREFLEDSVPHKTERDKLQEYVGYALYHWGLPFHKGLFLVGPKASGKSTFLDIVRKVIGEEGVSSLSPQQMVERFGGAELFGKWANIRSDIPSDIINNTGEFKEIVAGDPIKAEKKNKDPFMFRPTAKHFYSANTLPDTQDDDEAFYRRILLVAFPSSVPPAEQDRKLGQKLEDELPGIMNWALDGLQRLLDQGGFTADRDTGATADTWQKWGSTVDRFASVCVDTESNADPIPKKDAYRRYIQFCEAESMPAEPQRVFTRRIKTDHKVQDGQVTVDGRQQRCFLNLEWTHRAEAYAAEDVEDRPNGSSLDDFDGD